MKKKCCLDDLLKKSIEVIDLISTCNVPCFPKINIWENDNEVQVYIEAPGISPENLKLTLKGPFLYIKGITDELEVHESIGEYITREWTGNRKLEKMVFISHVIDRNGEITTKSNNGIIVITIPKIAPVSIKVS